MQTANELLGGILITLKSIDNKTGQGGSTAGGGIGTTISSVLGNFGKKEEAAKSATTFAGDISKIANDSDPKKLIAFSQGLTTFSQALPDIAKGLDELGRMKYRKVERATGILERLFLFMENMGDRQSQTKINKTLATFSLMGTVLKKMAKPLNSMAFLLLKFGLSIIGFVGSLLIASIMLGSRNPLFAIGAIIAIIGGFVGLMVLLGAMGGPVKKGSKVLRNMGLGLLALPLSLVIFVGALLIIPKMLNLAGGMDGMGKAILLIGGIIIGAVGIMAFVGLLDRQVKKGVVVMGLVALGIVILAGAALAVALAAKAISAIAGMGGGMEAEKKQKLLGMEVPPFVFGLGTMGLILLGGIALIAIFGIPAVAVVLGTGIAVALGISAGMVALAWSVRELVEVSQALKGVNVAENVANLISGTLIGFSNGVMWGLAGGKPGSNMSALDALKVAALVPARTAAILAGIGLVSGVAVSLSLFALSLRAFSKVGAISPIVGHTPDGKPIYGQSVTVATVAANIANSLFVFFSTLGDLFGPGGKAMIDEEKMNTILVALMGSGGFSLFGVPVLRTGPNLMDALYGFGEILTYWGKFGKEGRIAGGTDKEGNPIKGPKLSDVATNIATAISQFVKELGKGIVGMDKDLAKNSMEVAYILLGKQNTGALGWLGNTLGITRDRPGILEPVSKFGEIIKQFASGKVAVGTNPDGTTEYKDIDYKQTALKIVKGIQDFTVALSDGLTKADAGGINYGKKAKAAGAFLEDFEDLFAGLEKLSNAQDGMDRLATSLNNVGSGIGLIAENLNVLDTDKFEKIANTTAAYERKTADLPEPNDRSANASSGANRGRTGDDPDWDDISTMIGQQVGEQVTAALSSGLMKFEFSSPTGGIMTLESP